MNQEQFLISDISQISAGRSIHKNRHAFYKDRKNNPLSQMSQKIEEGKFRGMTEEKLEVKEDKSGESESSLNVTI
jgi:hypothetical protein